MKSQKLISAVFLTASMFVSFSATAANISSSDQCYEDDGLLSTNPHHNRNLDPGVYEFGATHKKYGSGFLDTWKFTLTETADISISVFDVEEPIGSEPLGSYGNGGHHGNSGYIFDNKYLTFSLFDHEGNLLGTAGENGTLSALNLLAGEWYTLTVSAKVNGMFGSGYHGSLEVGDPVPLGDSLPLFGSALLLLAVRNRRKLLSAIQ